MLHFIRKLLSTIKLLSKLGQARMFGQYLHSGWNGKFDFAVYRWHGQEWVIPTSCILKEEVAAPYKTIRTEPF